MEFAIFFFLAWLVIGIFIVLHKELTIVENTWVFLLLLIVIINVSWINTAELKLMVLTKNSIPYTAYLLNRSIIMPILLLIHLNILLKSRTIITKALTVIMNLLLLLGLSGLSTYFQITNYIKWNFVYDAIYFFILQLIAFYSYKFFKKATEKAVRYS